MQSEETIRMWKDEEYRVSAAMIETHHDNPAGSVSLPDDVLRGLSGGEEELPVTSWPCITLASATLSCLPECSKTFLIGTCGAFSYGRCA